MSLFYLLIHGLAAEARLVSLRGEGIRSEHPGLAAGRSSEEKWMRLLKLSCGFLLLV